MPTYEFRCGDDGPFEVVTPAGAAGQHTSCPNCGRASPRVFTPPMLARADRRIVAAIDRAEKSRDEPEVVSAPPPRSTRRPVRTAPPNPALKRLPRP